jgi:guanylate kinase
MQVLETRLRQRGTETEEAVAERLVLARRELEEADGLFHYAVVNDDLERCVLELSEILRAEREGRAAALRPRFDPRAALAALRGALPPRADRIP